MSQYDGIPNLTVGLDLGDQVSRVCHVNRQGKVVRSDCVHTTPDAVGHYFGSVPSCRIALEVGTHSPWVSRTLEQFGHEVIVANVTERYGGSRGGRRRRPKKRNDRLDAEELAREARLDVTRLHPIRHRRLTVQADLELLRARDVLVGARTPLINHARGAVKSYGARLGRCSAEAFSKRARNAIPMALLPALEPVLDLIDQLTVVIRSYDQRIEQAIVTRYPDADRLRREIPGVGPITALAFVLLIDDPRRFAHSRDVGAYFGLCPRVDNSSDSEPQLGITKAGDEFARRLLVSAAHYILGPFGPASDLRRHGEAIAARGGKNAKKRAVVAVARKLAVVMHRIWLSGRAYNPDHLLMRRQQA